jgi:hypothetical protein
MMRLQEAFKWPQKYLFNFSIFLVVILSFVICPNGLLWRNLQNGFHAKYRPKKTIKTDQL